MILIAPRMDGFVQSFLRGFILAALCLASPLGGAAQAADFVVASNGDPYEGMWRKLLIPSFEKETGFTVIWSAGTSAQNLAKLIAQKSNPQIDAALVDETQFVQGIELGLWEPLTPKDLGDVSKIVPNALIYDRGIAYGFSSVGLYYNTQIFEAEKLNPPSSWRDLLKPEYKGRISILSANNSAGLNALIAFNEINGGATPENMEPGFAMARQVAAQSMAIDTFGDTPQLIQQKAAIAGIWGQQRTVGLAATGVPIKFVEPKEGLWGHRLMAAVVKGRPAESTKAAKRWVALMLTRDVQASSLELNPMAVNVEVGSLEQTEMAGRLHFVDQQKLYPVRAQLVERWSREVEAR